MVVVDNLQFLLAEHTFTVSTRKYSTTAQDAKGGFEAYSLKPDAHMLLSPFKYNRTSDKEINNENAKVCMCFLSIGLVLFTMILCASFFFVLSFIVQLAYSGKTGKKATVRWIDDVYGFGMDKHTTLSSTQ